VRTGFGFFLLAALLLSSGALAEWQASEKVVTYRISGRSGAELYASIGENGPEVGATRTLAHTTFELTWKRKYEPRHDGACTLVSALPRLTIVYTLPERPASCRGDAQELGCLHRWRTGA